MLSATDPSSTLNRWPLVAVLAALLAILSIGALVTVDPRGLAQVGPALIAQIWVITPYAIVIVLGLARQPVAAGWVSVVLGALFLLIAFVLFLAAGRAALAFAVYFAGAIGLILLLIVASHLLMLRAGYMLVRRRVGAASLPLVILLTGNLVALGLVAQHGGRYLRSPERAQALAVGKAMDARVAILQLHRCLTLYQRASGRYPQSLADVGPAGTRCASEEFTGNRIAGFDLRYMPKTDAQAYDLLLFGLDPARAPYDHRRTDETGTIWHGLDAEGRGGNPDEDPTTSIQYLDICIEQYRLAHPTEGYPESLAAAQAKLRCYGELDFLAEEGRSVLELGAFKGYRFEYRPGPASGRGEITSFRLDTRPVAWGRPMRRSYLCTPEGTLHVTDEDRAAERSDPDMQTDRVTGLTNRSWCMGPDVPARR